MYVIAQKNSSTNESTVKNQNITSNASQALQVNETNNNESSLISIANQEQKSSRHSGKELLQANKDIIITATENVSQAGDNKTASAVKYPKPIVNEAAQAPVQTLASQGKWVGDQDELTETNLKTAPTIAKLDVPKNLHNQTFAAKNVTVTIIPDPLPKDNQNIQTEEQKQTRHRVGRIVGKTQNAMIQRAIEAAGNASQGSNQTDVLKEMVQKEQIHVQEQAENMQNIRDASEEVERTNSDRIQAQIEEDEQEEKKTQAAKRAKKNLSAKIGKNIAKNIDAGSKSVQTSVVNHTKSATEEKPQQPPAPAANTGDQTFQKLQQLDKQQDSKK